MSPSLSLSSRPNWHSAPKHGFTLSWRSAEHGFTLSRRSAEHGFTLSWRSAEHGFTLVELLVALFIFGMLSAAGVALLSFSVRSQAAAEERLGALADLRKASALVAADLAQAAPRLTRDAAGSVQPAFVGTEGGAVALGLVRRGWENVDDAPRSSLQKVEYRLAGDRLERTAYPLLDGSAARPGATLIEGVRSLRFRYRDRAGAWRGAWDPALPTELPVAVEMLLDIEGAAPVRQLFVTGGGG
jgi:general secretion pathway protein J